MDYFGEYTNQIINDIEENGAGFFENNANVSDKVFSLLKERENILTALATSDVRKRFIEILVANGMSEGSAKVTCSNFINLKKAVTRDNAICFCFAAGMNDEETDIILKKHLDFHGLHLRYYKDFIYAYFLRQNTGDNSVEMFSRANKYIDKYSDIYNGTETEQKISPDPIWAGELTETFEDIFEDIHTDEELDNYLSDKSTIAASGETNRTATGFYYSSLSRAISNFIDSVFDDTGSAIATRDKIYNNFYEDPYMVCEELIKLLNGMLNPYHAFIKDRQSRSDKAFDNYESPLSIYYRLYDRYFPAFEADYAAGGYAKIAKVSKDAIYNRLIQSIFNIEYYVAWNIVDSDLIEEGAFRDAYNALNITSTGNDKHAASIRSEKQIKSNTNILADSEKKSISELMNDKHYTWAKRVVLNNSEHIVYAKVNTIGSLIKLLIRTQATSDEITEHKFSEQEKEAKAKIERFLDDICLASNGSNNRFNAQEININILKFLFFFNTAYEMVNSIESYKPKTLINTINRNLIACKLPCLDPRKPFDYLLYASLYAEDPFEIIYSFISVDPDDENK